MIYHTCQPSSRLAPFIEWFWFYSDLETAHNRERVLPDGTFELVIDLSERPRKLFDRANPERYRVYRGAWLSGARADFILIDVVQNTSMMGAHFRPGGAAAFAGISAPELGGRVEETEGIWGAAMTRLRARLLEEVSTSRRFALLDEFLIERLRIPTRHDAIRWAVQRLASNPETQRTCEIAAQLGLSQKHFIDLFRNRVGLTPKKFCRVRRFQKALEQIEARRALDWAEIAADTGYYDQSHFIRDFYSFAGLNPSEYLRDRGEYIGFVPVRD